MVYARTSYNTRLTLRRLTAAWATQNTVRALPSAVFCSATFCQPWSCFASPYSGRQNVVNLKRYVPFLQGVKKYLTKQENIL